MKKVSEQIFEKCRPVWDKCYEHPFVQGIADGTLDHDKFRYFILQDHLYIMQYAKLFAIGLFKCDKEADIRAFYELIGFSIEGEDALHHSYFEKIGITQEMIDSATPSIANESYTSYMLTVAAKGGPAEVMAAAAACAWSYTYIGQRLAQIPGINEDDFFGPWTSTYTAEDCVIGNDTMMAMLDAFAAGYSQEEIDRLVDIVYICSQYEYNFWDTAWKMERTLLPVE